MGRHLPHATVYVVVLASVRAQRVATVHEVQPSLRDTVHAVWINGPTYSDKLLSSASAAWPAFQTGLATRSGSRCATRDDTRYTGYDDNGAYCEAASTAMDDNAHLILHSGRLGIVVDAGGLRAAASTNTRNLFPKVGVLGATATARSAYDTLSPSSTSISMDVTCGADTAAYVLGTTGDTFVQVGLVRQGHTVTQLSLTGLEFQRQTSGGVYGPCESFVPEQQSSASFAASVGRRLSHITNHHCNQDYGGTSHPCPSADYPACVGFVQGSGWGKCWSVCTAAGGHPNLWGELTVWGDSIAFELAWDEDFTLQEGCTGAITVAIGGHSSTAILPAGRRRLVSFDEVEGSTRADLAPNHDVPIEAFEHAPPYGAIDDALHFPRQQSATNHAEHGRTLTSDTQRRISLRLAVSSDGTSLTTAAAPLETLTVTSTAGRWVLSRPTTRDVVVEVPTSVGTCGYNTACSSQPLRLVDVVATNPDPFERQTLRLTFSRNFPVRDGTLAQSGTGAEITGLSTQLWETSSLQPTGVPMQISKNWHTGKPRQHAPNEHGAFRPLDCAFLALTPFRRLASVNVC